MYTAIREVHSILAYLLLAVLFVSIAWTLIAWIRRKPFTETIRKVSLAGMISAHLQLLVGILLYLVSPFGIGNFSGEAMGDALQRLYVLEHPLTMLIGIILITIGYSRAKRRGDDSRRYRQIVLFYTIGLLLILLRIPWTVWP